MSTAEAHGGHADLHLHSLHSDGLPTPSVVVERAAALSIRTIALTDHDTVSGVPEAQQRGDELGVAIIPGVEISVSIPDGGERHLLGYGVDIECKELLSALALNRGSRRERLDRILTALATIGIELSAEDVLRHSDGDSVGRPHVADALVAAGHVPDRQSAFDRWLADGKVAAVPKGNLPIAEAIRLVHVAGGVAVLAHPCRRHRAADVERLTADGLDGLEVIHPSHSRADQRALRELASSLGLIVTGGSDNHGDPTGQSVMADRRVPHELADELLRAIAERRTCAGDGRS